MSDLTRPTEAKVIARLQERLEHNENTLPLLTDPLAISLTRRQIEFDRVQLDLARDGQRLRWQPIETAPRDSRRVLVFRPAKTTPARQVFEAWWRIPFEGASPEQGWWCYDGDGTMLSADVHDGLGATLWMPLPAPPTGGE